jgi:hypothetical protein
VGKRSSSAHVSSLRARAENEIKRTTVSPARNDGLR